MKIYYHSLLIIIKVYFSRKFFQSKRQQSEKVASWTEVTLKKLKQVYIRILFEYGLIENQKGDRKIKTPIFEEEVKEHLYKIGDKIYIKAIIGYITYNVNTVSSFGTLRTKIREWKKLSVLIILSKI
ncbi:DUF1819 family protein [Clostridium botulinum D/C]|nr:DUF1819 family protein [Clostridium botulinum D/C]MCD3359665.1 DUF1819 family protein [Clostridium botulinum D/C]MCD3363429.1 DUF1819 family protein [Clostridium botulinum D/C]MCD3365362.1 DUF1819 family protein [Clostridium botulinum D/C]